MNTVTLVKTITLLLSHTLLIAYTLMDTVKHLLFYTLVITLNTSPRAHTHRTPHTSVASPTHFAHPISNLYTHTHAHKVSLLPCSLTCLHFYAVLIDTLIYTYPHIHTHSLTHLSQVCIHAHTCDVPQIQYTKSL